MSPRTVVLASAALAALLWAAPARASAALALGADYLVDPGAGAFELMLQGDTAVARHVTLGGRAGVALLTDPGRLGIPLDLRLRLRADRLYIDGLIGPWIVLDDDDGVRFHGAIGFGVIGRSFSFGLEVGVLHDTTMIGARLAFPL